MEKLRKRQSGKKGIRCIKYCLRRTSCWCGWDDEDMLDDSMTYTEKVAFPEALHFPIIKIFLN